MNLYAYVSNNPVTAVDEDGQILGKIWNGVKKIGNSICSFFINTFSKGNSEKKSSSTPKQSKITPSKPGHISLPTKGNPNSTQTKPNGDIRVYGSDGRALKDIDKSHPEHHPELQNPHVHDWSWENGKKSRSKGRNPLPDENIPAAITAGIGVVGVGYLVYRGVRMIPSLLPPLWWTAPANLVTP